TPPPDTADDLVRKYGIAPEQIPDGWHSPDVAWLLVEGGGEAHRYGAGDRLPIGLEAFPGRSHNDLVLWIERVGAVVTGDSLVDFGRDFEVPSEVLHHGVTRERWSKTCRRCSGCRSRSCCPPMEHRQTVVRSSVHSPEGLTSIP